MFEPKKTWNGIPVFKPEEEVPEETPTTFPLTTTPAEVHEETPTTFPLTTTPAGNNIHEDKIAIVEDVLAKMRSQLTAIKETKQSQNKLAVMVKELSLKLAEAQAEEIKVAEELLELEIEWQELAKELNNFSVLNVSSD